MKVKTIIFLVVLFIGISGLMIVKSFADTGSDNGNKSLDLLPAADIVKNYIHDNDIYSTIYVVEYADRIDIQKHYSKKSKISYLPDKSIFHSLLMCDITKNTAGNLNKYPIIRSSVMNDNIKNTVYDISRSDAKNKELNVLVSNGIYFDISYSPFLDVKKIADNTYMVVYQKIEYVKYIHTDNSKIVSETYWLVDAGFPSGGSMSGMIPVYPISGKILTDNIIRFEWKDGKIEHWKVRLTKEDIEKNKEYGLKQGFKNTEDNVLLWWNGVGNNLNYNKKKAWDYDEDTSKEPTYK